MIDKAKLERAAGKGVSFSDKQVDDLIVQIEICDHERHVVNPAELKRYYELKRVTGRSGYDHWFDFAVPKSKTAPERLLRAINNPTKDAAQALAFAWVDTREVRSPDSKAYAILNDRERPVPWAVDEALQSYEVTPVHWGRRSEVGEALAA